MPLKDAHSAKEPPFSLCPVSSHSRPFLTAHLPQPDSLPSHPGPALPHSTNNPGSQDKGLFSSGYSCEIHNRQHEMKKNIEYTLNTYPASLRLRRCIVNEDTPLKTCHIII